MIAESATNLSPLALILDDLRASNVRPTPLNILGRANDIGMTDADISLIVDELAAERGRTEVAA